MPQLLQFSHIRTLFISLLASVMTTQAIAIEEPVYQVEKAWEAEQIEIRAYAPRVMAVTGMTEDSDSGFRVLAGYIFGGNAAEQKIAMTAPVQQSMAGEKEMAFMIPAEYALEDLPGVRHLVGAFLRERQHRTHRGVIRSAREHVAE